MGLSVRYYTHMRSRFEADTFPIYRLVLDWITHLFRESLRFDSLPVSQRLDTALQWILFARRIADPEARIEAATALLDLTDVAVTQTSSIDSQVVQLRTNLFTASCTANDAATFAIDYGDLSLAVALLEQGRALIFGQLDRLRATAEDLEATHPDLAMRFVQLSQELDRLVVRRDPEEESHAIEDIRPTDQLQTRYVWETGVVQPFRY